MMGEAKRRQTIRPPTVYHHTSTLRTNLIWMAGHIALEGQGKDAIHPHLGTLKTNTLLRRELRDFPPLAWFTTRIAIPGCLLGATLMLEKDGQITELDLDRQVMNAIALNRVALGFRVADIPVIRWPNHFGYNTAEGRHLNETAQEHGDNPSDWYVADRPVDVALASEVWVSSLTLNPKLHRRDAYLSEVHRMVKLCRDNPRAFIPPTWMSIADQKALARSLQLSVA